MMRRRGGGRAVGRGKVGGEGEDNNKGKITFGFMGSICHGNCSLIHQSSAVVDAPAPPNYVAVSREGESVNLLVPDKKWRSVGRVPGTRGREVDCLAWICSGYEGGGGKIKDG